MIDWEGILSRDGPAVWRTAWRVLGNRADADDVFQETFVAALEYSRTHAVHHWRALLQRLAVARAIDRLRQRVRRRHREQPFPEDHLIASGPLPSQMAQAAELSASCGRHWRRFRRGRRRSFACSIWMAGATPRSPNIWRSRPMSSASGCTGPGTARELLKR